MDGPVRREIDGLTFLIAQVPGRKGLRAFRRLMKAVTPAVTRAAAPIVQAKSDGGKLEPEAVLASVVAGLDGLLEELSEADLDALVEVFFASVEVIEDGKKSQALARFDSVFAGRTSTALKVMAACVEVNYQSFFDGSLGGLLAKVTDLASDLKGSRKTSGSAGLSGASTTPDEQL